MLAEPAPALAVPRRPTGALRGASRRIHVLNAGGSGMSAVAAVLAQMGHRVSGVDANETPFLDRLRTLGVDVTVGGGAIDAAAADEVDLVVTSTATPVDHPDRLAVPADRVVHRRDVLATIGDDRRIVAVAGTHGKSTTTGMLATIARSLSDGSGHLAGTEILGFGDNADWRDASSPFIVEADESDATFLRLGAHDAIVTNLEADHLSFWGTVDNLRVGFERFVEQLGGIAVLGADDPGAAALVPFATNPITYGTSDDCDHVIDEVGAVGVDGRYRHTRRSTGESVVVRVPRAPGLHNASNAAAAIALAIEVYEVDLATAAHGLADFGGVARRFEPRGEAAGVTFVDSYDHLPTEVAAILAAASSSTFERVVCVFQPHRYTRTRDLAITFADAFVAADVVAITELYTAGEEPIPGVSGRMVHDAVVAAHPDADVTFTGDLGATADWMVETLRPGDLCLTLNAGDLTRVPDLVAERLRAARP